MNRISLAVTLRGWTNQEQNAFGAQLFSRGVTGARTVSNGSLKSIDGYEFLNFGSHSSRQHDGYLNVACAVGMTTREIKELVNVLKKETPEWAFFQPNVAGARGIFIRNYGINTYICRPFLIRIFIFFSSKLN